MRTEVDILRDDARRYTQSALESINQMVIDKDKLEEWALPYRQNLKLALNLLIGVRELIG